MPQSSEPVLFPAHEINHVHLQNNVLAMTKDELITGGFLIIPSEKFSIKVKYGSYLIHLFQGRLAGTTYTLDKLARN
jgi:hypothetical protein